MDVPLDWSGFVVAMRARLRQDATQVRREWLIVARWGEGGQYLSISRCLLPAAPGAGAPLALAPRETALAVLLPVPRSEHAPGFLFVRRLPPRMVVAGTFVPLEGFARLRARGTRLALTAEGRSPRAGAGAWRLDGVRAPWGGEFLDRLPDAAVSAIETPR